MGGETGHVHAVEPGAPGPHQAVGGLAHAARQQSKLQAPGECQRQGHRGGTRVQQEGHRLAVDGAAGHIVAHAVALEHHGGHAGGVQAQRRVRIGVVLALQGALEQRVGACGDQDPAERRPVDVLYRSLPCFIAASDRFRPERSVSRPPGQGNPARWNSHLGRAGEKFPRRP